MPLTLAFRRLGVCVSQAQAQPGLHIETLSQVKEV